MGIDRFHISIQVPTLIQPKARYALQQLSVILGIKFHLVDRTFHHPDAVYGDAMQSRSGCLWLPFDPGAYDPDAITLGSPSEMFFNLAKGLVRRDRTSLGMFKDGFAYLGRPNENPLFGFPGWRRLEAPTLRSCFYLFVKPKSLRRHLNDCRS